MNAHTTAASYSVFLRFATRLHLSPTLKFLNYLNKKLPFQTILHPNGFWQFTADTETNTRTLYYALRNLHAADDFKPAVLILAEAAEIDTASLDRIAQNLAKIETDPDRQRALADEETTKYRPPVAEAATDWNKDEAGQ